MLVFVLTVELEHAARLSPGSPESAAARGSSQSIVPAPVVSANSSPLSLAALGY